MMSKQVNQGRFSKQTVDQLAKRAGYVCSNPECKVLTAGPKEADLGAVIIGEAAHIYGVKPGSARYSKNLSIAGKSDITNGIWLCRNCHKMVDDNPAKYDPTLLFSWRRHHEEDVAQRLGRDGEAFRTADFNNKYLDFLIKSPLAFEIVTKRPELWEFKLTVALLDEPMGKIIKRLSDLERGFVATKQDYIDPEYLNSWIKERLEDLSGFFDVMVRLINEKFNDAWGPPGSPGDEWEILRSCELLENCCREILVWEEELYSTKSEPMFDEPLRFVRGIGKRIIESVADLPQRITDGLEKQAPSGTLIIDLKVDLPDEHVQQYGRIINKAVRKYLISKGRYSEAFGLVNYFWIAMFVLFLYLLI